MSTRAEAKRQLILDLATQVFQEMGFERANLDVISQRGGGSKATIYKYFANKEDLFFQVIFRSTEAEFETTHAALSVNEPDITCALEHFGQRFLTLLYSEDVLAFRRLLVAEGGRSDLGRKCYELGPGRSEAMVAEFLQRAMDQGKLRQADARLASFHLKGLLESELLDKFLFHTLGAVTAEEINAITHRAVSVFMSAYGPITKPVS